MMVTGVIGGNFNDIPGVSEDPSGIAVINFTSRAFHWTLTTLRDYPLGVAISLIIVILTHLLFTYPHADMLRRELEHEKNAKLVAKKKIRAKNRKGKGRK